MAEKNIPQLPQRRWPTLVLLAALVAIVAGMKAAAPLLEPFLLAIFFSIFCAPLVNLLRRFKLPEWLAVTLVISALLLVLLVIAAFLGASINGFIRHLPDYQEVLAQRLNSLVVHLNGLGLHLNPETLHEELDPGTLMGLAGNLVGHLGAALGNLVLVLLAVAFILMEAAHFPAKLHAALGDVDRGMEAFDRFVVGVKDYLAIKSALSLVTGAAVTLWLWFCGVDYPLLWGMLAFLFNYIPNIGAFLAAIPACLLAFVLHGTGNFLLVGTGYLVINMITGNILEPRLLGRSLGLSTLVVFCSMVLWGWVLGPIGMVLSVPLTMILRIGLDSHDNTRWLAILLGPEVSK